MIRENIGINDKRKDDDSKVLFICNTPFQCMTAIAICYQNVMSADLIVTDKMSDSDRICNNIRKTKVFKRVYKASVRSLSINKNDGKINKFKKTIIHYFRPSEIIKRTLEDKLKAYNKIYVHNIECFEEAIFYFQCKKFNECNIYLFDEGYETYVSQYENQINPKNIKIRLLRVCAKLLLSRKFMNSSVKGIYLYDPELMVYKSKYPIIKIDRLNANTDVKKIFNIAFGYKEVSDEYDKQFIFFEECFSFDGGNENDKDLKTIKNIAELVKPENFMVKLHPRNIINRFQSIGITTNKIQGIPWEVIAMNLDKNKNKVFITYSSGAVISYKILFGLNFTTIMIFDCMKDGYHKPDPETREYFYKFKLKYPDNLYIPQNESELRELLLGLANLS